MPQADDASRRQRRAEVDVIVVGSGAGGATAALVLVNAGARVLMLEAGRMLTPGADFLSHEMPWDLRFRGEGPPGTYDTWGRSCFRHGPLDFKPATRQGYGDDWPLDYDEHRQERPDGGHPPNVAQPAAHQRRRRRR